MAFHRALTAAALLSLASGQMHEPLVIGQTFMAGSMDPTQGSAAWALASHGIAEKLFTVDREGNIVGQVAESVRKVSQLVWEVTLKADYKFSDGTAVTAERVADALTRLNGGSTNARASVGVMTVTAPGALKVRIESERATPVMDAVLAEWPFAVHLLEGGKWLFTGPYAVETYLDDDRIELIPNPHYPRAAERPLLVIKKYGEGAALAAALKAGEVDMAFHLPVDELTELRALDDVTVKSFEVGYHYMMFHNIRKPELADVRVRKAIDMALDRQELTQELRAGHATRSLFPEETPYFQEDTAALNHDRTAAAQLLEQAGWVMDGASGQRKKDGAQLTLDLVAYPQRPGLVLMQPVIERTLDALGIKANLIVTDGSSWDELDAILADKSFDLLLWAQHTLPAGDPQWFLNAFFRSDGGNNHAGLNSSTVDELLDALANAEDQQRVAATTAAHSAILEEMPVSNLMTPEWHVGFSSRLASYQPWGSDYYVIRADLGIPPQAPTPDPDDEANSASRALGGLVARSLVPLLAYVAAGGGPRA